MPDYRDFRKSDDIVDRRRESHHRPITPHYQGMGRMLLDDQTHSRLSKALGSSTLDNRIGSGEVDMAKETGDSDKKQAKSSGGDMPTMSPGVMKWMMEFLKANPDLAKEMSTRMNAVINGKTIQAQQGKGPPPPPGGAMMPGMAGPPGAGGAPPPGAGGAPPQMPGAMSPQMPKPPGM